ncbi:MAG TPA: sigma-70 family RNA polymerase sigma factor [Parasegetibacter sp.]
MQEKENNEQHLIREIKQGNQEAMKVVFRTYYPRLLFFTLQIVADEQEAEDIVQEALFNFWLNISTKKLVPEHTERYLFKMVRNRCMNALKRKQRIDNKTVEIRNHLYTDTDQKLEELRVKEHLFNRIAESFVHLTHPQQEVMKSIYLKGLSVQQIAEQLKTTPNNIRNHKARAIERLKQVLLNDKLLLLIAMLNFF